MQLHENQLLLTYHKAPLIEMEATESSLCILEKKLVRSLQFTYHYELFIIMEANNGVFLSFFKDRKWRHPRISSSKAKGVEKTDMIERGVYDKTQVSSSSLGFRLFVS